MPRYWSVAEIFCLYNMSYLLSTRTCCRLRKQVATTITAIKGFSAVHTKRTPGACECRKGQQRRFCPGSGDTHKRYVFINSCNYSRRIWLASTSWYTHGQIYRWLAQIRSWHGANKHHEITLLYKTKEKSIYHEITLLYKTKEKEYVYIYIYTYTRENKKKDTHIKMTINLMRCPYFTIVCLLFLI